MAKTQLNAAVTGREEIAPGTIILRVAPVGWELPAFNPGQFTVLGLPGSAPRCPGSDPDAQEIPQDKLILRAYSIASSSVAKEYMEFYITLVRSGELTPRLFQLKIGDKLWLQKKVTGFFTLETVPREANVILVATGTGLAPYMSMIRSELARNTNRRYAVIHGAYHSWDLGYRQELETLRGLSSVFTYIPVISDPQDEPVPWHGETGFVQHVWNKRMIEKAWGLTPTPENTHVFLCGNPAMVEDMEKILSKEGFTEHTRKSPGTYHLERYW